MARKDIAVNMWDGVFGLDGVVQSGDPPTQGRNLVLKSGGAIQNQAAPVSLTASIALLRDLHGERPLVLNAAAGETITLPAATGSGAEFTLYVGTALSSNNYIVQVANGADYMRGQAQVQTSNFQTSDTGTVATESDTVTMNGTTTGGVVGSKLTFKDIAAHIWVADLNILGSGTAATVFSAAV